MNPMTRARLRDESGIAMVVVILAVMIVTILGASLMVSSIRDLDSSTSVQRASTALGIAEAGVQRATLVLKTFGPTSNNVSKMLADDSCSDPAIPACEDTITPGSGRWIRSDDPKQAPPRNEQFVGNVGTGLYRTYIQAVIPIDLPQVKEGVYKIVATGFDRRDRPTRPGERTVEQFVRLQVVDLPFGLFSQSNVVMGGTPKVLNEALWTSGDVKHRGSLTFEKGSDDPACPYPQGCDLFYGWDGSKCQESPAGTNRCPLAVHATGVIYRGNGDTETNAKQGPIHFGDPPHRYQSCEFPYDRDSRGGPYSASGGWQSASWRAATGCTLSWPDPSATSYSSSLMASSDFPFDVNGPTEDTYQFMKEMAQSTGTFCTHDSTSTVSIQWNGQPASPRPCNRISMSTVPSGFVVIYVEGKKGVSNLGAVTIDTGWGPNVANPETMTPCDPNGSFGVIIVRNTRVKYNNNANWWGAAFVPEGEFEGAGAGSPTTGWFIGTIYAKNIGDTGNMKFQLNHCWIDDVAGPWFAVSRLRWHESDR